MSNKVSNTNKQTKTSKKKLVQNIIVWAIIIAMAATIVLTAFV